MQGKGGGNEGKRREEWGKEGWHDVWSKKNEKTFFDAIKRTK